MINYSEQIIEAVKNKLIEIGYLTNDSSMKICSNIYLSFSLYNANREFAIVNFTVNDDYAIYVKIKISNIFSGTLHCNLQISEDTEILPNRYSDDAFDIEFEIKR